MKKEYGLNVGGAVVATWFLVEAIFNVGRPPAHWRIYVLVLSLGLFHRSLMGYQRSGGDDGVFVAD